MKTNNSSTGSSAAPSQPPASGQGAYTPTPFTLKESSHKREFVAFILDANGHEVACVENVACRSVAQNLEAAAFIVRACNSHAALVEALDKLEASAVNLHCALQSTAHMDPADRRIPVITGQVVKDLLVMRDQARAALTLANE